MSEELRQALNEMTEAFIVMQRAYDRVLLSVQDPDEFPSYPVCRHENVNEVKSFASAAVLRTCVDCGAWLHKEGWAW